MNSENESKDGRSGAMEVGSIRFVMWQSCRHVKSLRSGLTGNVAFRMLHMHIYIYWLLDFSLILIVNIEILIVIHFQLYGSS